MCFSLFSLLVASLIRSTGGFSGRVSGGFSGGVSGGFPGGSPGHFPSQPRRLSRDIVSVNRG